MGALTFAFIDPEEARTWVDRVREDAGRRCVPVGWSRQPAGGVREPDDDPPRRGRGDPPGSRGRQLLRLQPRPLLRVRHPPPRPAPTCGPSTRQRRGAQGFDPEAVARAVQGGARSAPRSPPATPPGCAAASARRSRPASTCGATRRPASTRWSSCCRPGATGTRTSWNRSSSSVARCSRVRRARRGRVGGQGRPPRPDHRGRARPAGPSDQPRDLGDYEFPAIPRQWADASGSVEMARPARPVRRRPRRRQARHGGRDPRVTLREGHRRPAGRAALAPRASSGAVRAPSTGTTGRCHRRDRGRARPYFRLAAAASLGGLSTPLASASSR